jgi:protein-tyrosine-phosphatase
LRVSPERGNLDTVPLSAMSLFETLQHRRARVLFVSNSNLCRTQMAEAFARALGEDSMLAFSAAAAPAAPVAPATIGAAVRTVMQERGTPLFCDQRPHPLSALDLARFDVLVNLGMSPLPAAPAMLLEPLIPSPLPGDLDSHRAVRDRIEELVRFLAEHFRRAREWAPSVQAPAQRQIQTKTQPAARS